MAGHTWELDRDLGLAVYRGDTAEIQRLEIILAGVQAQCDHVENPERVSRCYKCGQEGLQPKTQEPAPRPGLVKAALPTCPFCGLRKVSQGFRVCMVCQRSIKTGT